MDIVYPLILLGLISFFFYDTIKRSKPSLQRSKPPEMLVLYNSWPGDHEYPLFRNRKMSPVKPINIYSFKNSNSQIVKTVQPGELITLITADFHTFPANSAVLVLEEKARFKQGDIVYLLSYVGTDNCLVWYDNTVLHMPVGGIAGTKLHLEQRQDVAHWAKLTGQLPSKPELWLHVRTDDNKHGWIYYNEPEWKHFCGSVFM